MEFADFLLPPIESDHKRVLVLAGDIGLARQGQTYLPFLKTVAGHFRQVLWVLGNHEHYGDSIIKSREHIEYALSESGINNVHILENEAFTVDNVTFPGATLWADVRDNAPPTTKTTLGSMDDYFGIRCGTDSAPFVRNLSPDDTISIHRESRAWLLEKRKSRRKLDGDWSS